jgi:hypothetical protein
MRNAERQPRLFRVWIATYADWRPARWNEAPPRATAVELVEDAAYSPAEAALFLEGFNSAMLEFDEPLWAVAVPVEICYLGDATAGAAVAGYVFDEPAPAGDEPPAGGGLPGVVGGGYFQGLDQSPQRSR